mmetsp:Transcript_65559/g.143764  ORF Transcript_65559/g.143764 Transcript_65559/m.143764 type:complete len:211 (+) Transcript_65559:461-1093(+)
MTYPVVVHLHHILMAPCTADAPFVEDSAINLGLHHLLHLLHLALRATLVTLAIIFGWVSFCPRLTRHILARLHHTTSCPTATGLCPTWLSTVLLILKITAAALVAGMFAVRIFFHSAISPLLVAVLFREARCQLALCRGCPVCFLFGWRCQRCQRCQWRWTGRWHGRCPQQTQAHWRPHHPAAAVAQPPSGEPSARSVDPWRPTKLFLNR